MPTLPSAHVSGPGPSTGHPRPNSMVRFQQLLCVLEQQGQEQGQEQEQVVVPGVVPRVFPKELKAREQTEEWDQVYCRK